MGSSDACLLCVHGLICHDLVQTSPGTRKEATRKAGKTGWWHECGSPHGHRRHAAVQRRYCLGRSLPTGRDHPPAAGRI